MRKAAYLPCLGFRAHPFVPAQGLVCPREYVILQTQLCHLFPFGSLPRALPQAFLNPQSHRTVVRHLSVSLGQILGKTNNIRLGKAGQTQHEMSTNSKHACSLAIPKLSASASGKFHILCDIFPKTESRLLELDSSRETS